MKNALQIKGIIIKKMTQTYGKQINNLFEKIYHLFEDAIMIPEYLNLDNHNIQNTIIEFMDDTRIEGEWDMTDEDRQGFGTVYFEAGYHDSNAVYYPFKDTNDIDKIKLNELFDTWENALECIIDECKEEENVRAAELLLQQLKAIYDNVIYNVIPEN